MVKKEKLIKNVRKLHKNGRGKYYFIFRNKRQKMVKKEKQKLIRDEK